jgi:hypothetical protein
MLVEMISGISGFQVTVEQRHCYSKHSLLPHGANDLRNVAGTSVNATITPIIGWFHIAKRL